MPSKNSPLKDYLFRAVVLLALCVVAVGFSFTQNPPSQPPKNQGEVSQTASKHNLTKTFWEKVGDDPTAFFTMTLAFLSAVLAAVSVIQIYYLRESDKTARIAAYAAQASAEVASKSLIASNRAWLKVQATTSAQNLIIDANGVNFTINLSFRNIGNAPALRIFPQAWMLVLRSESEKHPFSEHERRCATARETRPRMNFSLFPDEVFPDVVGPGLWGLSVNLPPEELVAGLKAGASDGQGRSCVMLYVAGSVTYEFSSDIGRRHQTSFMLEVRRVGRQAIVPDGTSMQSVPVVLSETMFGHGNGAD